MPEDRKEKFTRLATRRVNVTLQQLRLIGNLSNRSNYDYEGEEVDKIFEALSEALRRAKFKFNDTKTLKKFEL